MLHLIVVCISLLSSSPCLAKGFVVGLLERNIIFFDEHEDEHMESEEKEKLNKLELRDLLVGPIAKEIEKLGIPWTCLNGPSIHSYMHRILYIFRNHKVVYKIEVSNIIEACEKSLHLYDDSEWYNI
ncbi:MAG: hypothetical protein AB8G05_24130 [Oligoflexales bacterium]